MTTTRNGTPPLWTARATRPLDARHDTDINRDGSPAVPGIRYETYVTDTGATSRVRVTSTARLAFGDDRSPITATLAHNPPTIELVVRARPITPDIALELARALVDAVHVATGKRYAVQPINADAYDVQRMAATDAGGTLTGLPDGLVGELLRNGDDITPAAMPSVCPTCGSDGAPFVIESAADPDGRMSYTRCTDAWHALTGHAPLPAHQDEPAAARARAAHALWATEGTAPAVQTLATHTIRCLALDRFGDDDLDELAREVADRLDYGVTEHVKALGIAGDPGPVTREAMLHAARRVLDDIAEQDRDAAAADTDPLPGC